jgi:hypothetical protein
METITLSRARRLLPSTRRCDVSDFIAFDKSQPSDVAAFVCGRGVTPEAALDDAKQIETILNIPSGSLKYAAYRVVSG